MLLKKMMCFALGVGIGAGAYYVYNNASGVEQKLRCLKRKLRKLEKDLTKALNNLKPEQMQSALSIRSMRAVRRSRSASRNS